MKIITIHYIMKNSQGEILQQASTSFPRGSTGISPALQSQLEDMNAGDHKTILLPKDTEDADDDFIFEVTMEAVRDATPDEIRLGRYLPPMKIHLLSGFLAAGKTTAIEQACLYLTKQNTPVAVITNDQGNQLVDGHRFLHMGIPSREVTGGCFCCNYDNLDENIRQLTTHSHPTMIFAESVGSCTDLIATVLKPLLDQHPEWQPTVSIFANAELLTGSSFAPSVRYIYDKQLEEAQVIVVTRSEAFSTEWKQNIREKFAPRIVLFHNSYEESDIRRWLQTLENLPSRPQLPSLDIDYDIYADGEARLAWLDQELIVDSLDTAQRLMTAITNKIKETNYPIGNLKFFPSPASLLINARVQTDPQTLARVVAEAIAETGGNHGIKTLTQKAFQPGYPRPTHRIA